MANYPAKVVIFGETYSDLTADTVGPQNTLVGAVGHDHTGTEFEGACTYDADTSDGTATASTMLEGTIAYSGGVRRVGEIPIKGAVSGTISTKAGEYKIPYGMHDGSGTVRLSGVDELQPANVRAGVTILGIVGEMSDTGGEVPQNKEVSPTLSDQLITPDEGYTCLRQVLVKGVPVRRIANPTGGETLIVG